MGLISKLLSFTHRGNKSETKSDPGSGANITADHFSAPGDDGSPLPDDYICLVDIPGSGKKAAVGYIDFKNAAVTEAGERRMYARDSSGTVVGFVYLRNSGVIDINGSADFAVRYSALETAFNQLLSDFNDLVTAFNAHGHTGVTTGPGSSGPTNTPGVASASDITPAKVDEVRLP